MRFILTILGEEDNANYMYTIQEVDPVCGNYNSQGVDAKVGTLKDFKESKGPVNIKGSGHTMNSEL